MVVLNRCAITVTPREPMRTWRRPFETREDMEALEEESLYLVPPFDDEQEAQRCIASHCSAIFEAELDLWCRDRRLWPQQRDAEQFHRWFQVRVFPLVEDLARIPLSAYDSEGRLLQVRGTPAP